MTSERFIQARLALFRAALADVAKLGGIAGGVASRALADADVMLAMDVSDAERLDDAVMTGVQALLGVLGRRPDDHSEGPRVQCAGEPMIDPDRVPDGARRCAIYALDYLGLALSLNDPELPVGDFDEGLAALLNPATPDDGGQR